MKGTTVKIRRANNSFAVTIPIEIMHKAAQVESMDVDEFADTHEMRCIQTATHRAVVYYFVKKENHG
jgi:antitoxin component of MazEF toxin-antitoxin module